MKRLLVALVLLASLSGCDQVTKRLAEGHLRGGSVTLIEGVFDLTYAENRDVGFGLLRFVESDVARRGLITALVSAGLIAILLMMVRERDGSRATLSGLALLGAGAVGNLVDRVARGYVVDFLHLHHWPVFNVADVCVVAGAALILWGSYRASGGLPRPEDEARAPDRPIEPGPRPRVALRLDRGAASGRAG